MGVIDLSAYKPVPATLGDANQVANGFQAIQNLVNGSIDNNNFAAGRIFDPAKLMQNAAIDGDPLVWDNTLVKWVPASTLAAGRPRAPRVIVSTLAGGPPGSPVDQDIWIATAVDSHGTRWAFQYNAGSASASKWEFIGGPPSNADIAGNMATSSLTPVALTSGPTMTVPRTGDYIIKLGLFSQCTAGFASAYDSFANVSQTAVAVTSNAHFTHTASFAGGNIGISSRTPLTIGSTLDVRVTLGSAGGTNTFSAAWFDITPIRIT